MAGAAEVGCAGSLGGRSRSNRALPIPAAPGGGLGDPDRTQRSRLLSSHEEGAVGGVGGRVRRPHPTRRSPLPPSHRRGRHGRRRGCGGVGRRCHPCRIRLRDARRPSQASGADGASLPPSSATQEASGRAGSGYTSRVSPTPSCPADNLPPPGQGTGSGLTGRVSPTPGALGADANPNPKPTPIPAPGPSSESVPSQPQPGAEVSCPGDRPSLGLVADGPALSPAVRAACEAARKVRPRFGHSNSSSPEA